MKVAFLQDDPGYIGGAELTMREFRLAAPDEVELVPLEDAETVVVGNCASYGPDLKHVLAGKKVIRYFNDVDPHSDRNLREWFLTYADCVFTSLLHIERFPYELPPRSQIVPTGQKPVGSTKLIPPAVDLDAFRPPRRVRRNQEREGTCTIGVWQNEGKGQMQLLEWSEQNGPVDVYGDGAFVPHGPNLNPMGPLEPDKVAQTLWQYERFAHLPTAVEPFGRSVVEAWAAGCELVVNKLVGARYWIEEAPEKLETAAADFWKLVLV